MAVFALDWALPVGLTVELLQVPVILLTLFLPGERAPWVFGGLTTLFVVLGYTTHVGADEQVGLLLSRGLMLAGLWLAVAVVLRYKRMRQAQRKSEARAEAILGTAADSIVDAVRAVLDGRVSVSDEINDRLLQSMSEGGRERMMQPPLDLLSDRELEVFELIGKGRSTREVTERLHLSVKTVESYRSRVKDKLQVDSSNELMKHAVQWVEGEDSL